MGVAKITGNIADKHEHAGRAKIALVPTSTSELPWSASSWHPPPTNCVCVCYIAPGRCRAHFFVTVGVHENTYAHLRSHFATLILDLYSLAQAALYQMMNLRNVEKTLAFYPFFLEQVQWPVKQMRG